MGKYLLIFACALMMAFISLPATAQHASPVMLPEYQSTVINQLVAQAQVADDVNVTSPCRDKVKCKCGCDRTDCKNCCKNCPENCCQKCNCCNNCDCGCQKNNAANSETKPCINCDCCQNCPCSNKS